MRILNIAPERLTLWSRARAAAGLTLVLLACTACPVQYVVGTAESLDLGRATDRFEEREITAAGGSRSEFVDLQADVLAFGGFRFSTNQNGAAMATAPSVSIESGSVLATPGTSQARFGGPIAVFDEQDIVVGAHNDAVLTTRCGTAMVYRRQPNGTFQALASLFPRPSREGQEFGKSVAAEGELVAVGAPGLFPGSAYVFRDNAGLFTPDGELASPNFDDGETFGSSVAVSSGLVAVGSPGSVGAGGNNAGAVNVFEFDAMSATWSHVQRVLPPSTTDDERFGETLAMDGTTLIVGAPTDGAVAYRGSVYVYELAGGAFEHRQTITQAPDDEGRGGLFGYALDLDGDDLVVSAKEVDASSVTLYRRSGGQFEREHVFVGTDLDYGADVAVDDGRVAIAVPSADAGRRSAFLYEPAAAKRAARRPARLPKNSYLAFQSSKKSLVDQSGEIELPRPLFAPGGFSVRAGALDPKRSDDLTGAAVVAGLRSDFGDVEVRATYTADGLRVQAATEGGPVGNTTDFAGARVVDLSLEHDGSEVVLSARPLGASGFTEIGRRAYFTTAARPYVRSDAVPPGTQVGFDDPVFDVRGAAPDDRTAEERLVDAIVDAFALTAVAAGRAGRADTDRDGAGEALTEAESALAFAQQEAEDVLAGAPKRKAKKTPQQVAAKRLAQARAQVAKARKKLDKGKKAKAVVKALNQAGKRLAKALQVLGVEL